MTAEILSHLRQRAVIARATHDFWTRQAMTALGGDLADRMAQESGRDMRAAQDAMNGAADQMLAVA